MGLDFLPDLIDDLPEQRPAAPFVELQKEHGVFPKVTVRDQGTPDLACAQRPETWKLWPTSLICFLEYKNLAGDARGFAVLRFARTDAPHLHELTVNFPLSKEGQGR